MNEIDAKIREQYLAERRARSNSPAREENEIQDPQMSKDPNIAFQYTCLLYTSPSPRDQRGSRMPSSA